VSSQPRICIVSASGQNVFFAEILEAFGAALKEHGLVVEESVDHFPHPAEDLVYLFVPHEYQPLVQEVAYPSHGQLQRSVAICTEQPGTAWFDAGAAIAARAGAAVDINVLGVQELRRRGVDAEYAPLGYIPDWDVWHRKTDDERPVDLAFLGAYSERRGQVLARSVPALADRACSIHLFETGVPHTAADHSFLSHERKWNLMADSRLLLNVHQDPRAYLEWQRVMCAAINGCVVLSEHSLATEPLVPGEHFISASYDDIPRVLPGLFAEPERLDRIRDAAYDLIREQMPMSIAVDALLRAFEKAARRPVTPNHSPVLSPMPKDPPSRMPGWESNAAIIGDQLPVRTALKHLIVQNRKLEQQVRALSISAEDGGGDDPIVEELGPPLARPRVSVLLTVYNYAGYVGEALRSVALSTLTDVEVVVVDDASSDGSVEAIRQAGVEMPWLSIRLVRRQTNGGLSAARNLAAEHANADLLFVLDADNMVLPAGLEKLAGALDENPDAAFAYGIIETFDVNGPSGLISWLGWNPDRLRYGNYIDAMAMIRASALEEVGGYSTDAAFSTGWEDFALWVAMADRGLPGLRLADFVGRYRINPHSMLSITDIDNSAIWAALLRRHPFLAKEPAALSTD
jgi:Glycosyl transferase family 2